MGGQGRGKETMASYESGKCHIMEGNRPNNTPKKEEEKKRQKWH